MIALVVISHSLVRNAVICLNIIVKWIIQGFYGSKMMGSETHCSKIDGFLGTNGTRANRATVSTGPEISLYF